MPTYTKKLVEKQLHMSIYRGWAAIDGQRKVFPMKGGADRAGMKA